MNRQIFAFTTAIALAATTIAGPLNAKGQMKAGDETVQSLAEMRRLVSESTDARAFLACAILSKKLSMDDVYGMFVRKAGTLTDDSDALILALAYMAGAMETDLMELSQVDEDGQGLALLYSQKCMPELLPK